MVATTSPILVREFPSPLDFERRHDGRHECALDATTRPLDAQDSLSWGATVRDISMTGIGLTLCFPFRTGAYLAIDLFGKNSDRPAKTLLTRVVHVREQTDGSWHLGCQFVKPLSDEDLEALI